MASLCKQGGKCPLQNEIFEGLNGQAVEGSSGEHVLWSKESGLGRGTQCAPRSSLEGKTGWGQGIKWKRSHLHTPPYHCWDIRGEAPALGFPAPSPRDRRAWEPLSAA